MKILQLCSYFLPHKGGIEYVVYGLSKELVKRGHQVTVISSMVGSSLPEEDMDGIIVKRVPAKVILKSPLSFQLLWKLVKEEPDVIHLHHPHPFFLETGIFYAKMRGIPVVLHCHGAEITMKGFANVVAKTYNMTALKMNLMFAKRIIVHSNKLVEGSKLLNKYKEKVRVMKAGFDEEKYNGSAKKIKTNLKRELGIEEDKVILYVGQLRQYKRIDILIDALKDIVKNLDKVKLVIVGKGDKEKELKKQAAELGLDKSIIFAGFVEDDKLLEYYSIADVFVLPSANIEEGFGLVALEAAAMEVPIVVTSGAGIGEAFTRDKIGHVIKPYNTKEMGEVIVKVLKNRNNEHRKAKSYKKTIEEYSWRKLVDGYVGVYQDILGSGK